MAPRLSPDFWANVDVRGPDECWHWLRSVRSDGYGQIRINGRPDRAHRQAYRIAKGEIPEGLFVCHTCDNRLCCNPAHLWLGAAVENVRDMIAKKRNRPPTKLTPADVLAIRKMRTEGTPRQTVARDFGIHISIVDRIMNGTRRSDIR